MEIDRNLVMGVIAGAITGGITALIAIQVEVAKLQVQQDNLRGEFVRRVAESSEEFGVIRVEFEKADHDLHERINRLDERKANKP